jgi:hypothetical protein
MVHRPAGGPAGLGVACCASGRDATAVVLRLPTPRRYHAHTAAV